MRPRRWVPLLLALGLLNGCQSLTVPLNQPLPMTEQGAPDHTANYGLAGILPGEATLVSPAAESDLLVFVTFSGGAQTRFATGRVAR